MTREIPLASAFAVTRKNKGLLLFCMTLLLLAVTTFSARPAAAATYYVGTCRTGSFPTIGRAIAAVPAGSTIMICPGTYAEDLSITKPLTLHGFRAGDSSQVLIQPVTVPLVSSTSFLEVSPIILVNAGPVNFSNLTVGTPTTCPSSNLVGIFYSDGFGTLDHVTMDVSGPACNQIGEIDLLLENGTSTVSTTTVENSIFNEPGNYGIFACSTPTSSVVNISGNYFYNSSLWLNCNTAGNVTRNFMELTSILTESPGTVFSGNTVSDGDLEVAAPDVQIKNNNFYHGDGIKLFSTGVTVSGNKFFYAPAVNFNCYMATVTGNTIFTGEYNQIYPYGNAPTTFQPSDTLINVPNLFYGSCP